MTKKKFNTVEQNTTGMPIVEIINFFRRGKDAYVDYVPL